MPTQYNYCIQHDYIHVMYLFKTILTKNPTIQSLSEMIMESQLLNNFVNLDCNLDRYTQPWIYFFNPFIKLPGLFIAVVEHKNTQPNNTLLGVNGVVSAPKQLTVEFKRINDANANTWRDSATEGKERYGNRSRKKQTAERSESWRRLQPGNSKSNDDCEVIVVKSTQNVKIKS